MGKSPDSVTNLSEAISNIENGHGKSRNFFEKEIHDIKESLENLKPYLKDFKNSVEHTAKDAKHQVEEKVRQSPWLALGIVGIIGFFVGWILGNTRK